MENRQINTNIISSLSHYAEVLVIAKFEVCQYILMTDSTSLKSADTEHVV